MMEHVIVRVRAGDPLPGSFVRLIATRGADEALLVDHEQKTVFLSSHSSWEEFEPGLEIKP